MTKVSKTAANTKRGNIVDAIATYLSSKQLYPMVTRHNSRQAIIEHILYANFTKFQPEELAEIAEYYGVSYTVMWNLYITYSKHIEQTMRSINKKYQNCFVCTYRHDIYPSDDNPSFRRDVLCVVSPDVVLNHWYWNESVPSYGDIVTMIPLDNENRTPYIRALTTLVMKMPIPDMYVAGFSDDPIDIDIDIMDTQSHLEPRRRQLLLNACSIETLVSLFVKAFNYKPIVPIMDYAGNEYFEDILTVNDDGTQTVGVTEDDVKHIEDTLEMILEKNIIEQKTGSHLWHRLRKLISDRTALEEEDSKHWVVVLCDFDRMCKYLQAHWEQFTYSNAITIEKHYDANVALTGWEYAFLEYATHPMVEPIRNKILPQYNGKHIDELALDDFSVPIIEK